MSRITHRLVLVLALAIPRLLEAQTCQPPVIIQVGGTNPVCAGQAVMLDAGAGWTTYQWSPGGATTRMISDTPAATMSYTVTTTDANGCSVTSQPLTVAVSNVPAAPTIQLRETTLCEGALGEATVSGTWTSYAWSVTNGAIVSGENSATVDYSPSGAGSMTLSVTATDSKGCAVTASAGVTLRMIEKPAVQTYPAAICAGAYGSASINPPAEGSWQSYHWTITNGTIAPWSGDSSSYVSFNSDAGGQPVVVQVTATDSYGCTTTSDPITIPVRTIAKPVVQTYPAAICAGAYGSASINPPAEGSWQSYHWTITNGTIAPWSGDSSSYVSFNSDAAGQPVVVQVTATDSYGCTSTSDPITIPVRTIAKPVVQTYPAAICAGAYGSASINPPAEGSWQSYHWTITNGTIAPWSGDSSSYVSFNSDAAGQPVSVQVTATDSYGCTSTSDPITIPVRTIAKPVVQTYPAAICAGAYGSASINPPAEGSWQSYHWTVTNGTVASWSGDSSSYVSFNSDAGGQPVSVQVTATDSYGCTSTSDPITIPVRTIAKPVVQTYPAAICAGAYGSASINPPAEGSWQSYHWTVTNGTIASWSGDSSSYVSFNSDAGGQPVVVQVTATDSYGCTSTSDPITIPVRVIDPPPIIVASPSVCPGGYLDAHIDSPGDPSGAWQSVSWSASNAVTPDGGTTGAGTEFFARATGGPVTLSVSVTDNYGCSATSTREIPVAANPPAAVITLPPNVCAGSIFSVSAHDPNGVVQNFQFYATNAILLSVEAGGTASFQAGSAGAVDIYATSMSPSNSCDVYGQASTMAVNPAVATISASGPTSICAGSTVTLTAPAGMLSYSWSNGATTQSITVGNAGSYTVTVSNAPGCSTTSDATVVTVNTPAVPTITASGPTTFCAGGSVTLTASSGASYLWSTGATTQSVVVGASGNYSVTVTNASGCSATSASTSVNVNALPTLSIVVSAPQQYTALVAATDGQAPYELAALTGPNTYSFCGTSSVNLIALGGDSSSTFQWSTGAATRTINVAQSGTYTVTLTSAAGCAVSDRVTVNLNPYPAATITASGPLAICPNGGSVILTANAADSYLWSTGETTQSITVTQPGPYNVRVTTAGCSATSSDMVVTMSDPGVITGGLTFCAGGSATLTAPAASSYAWSNGANTQSITVSTPGNYSVTIVDASGCSVTPPPVTVSQSALSVGVSASATTICSGQTATLTANATGGSGYTYQWLNGNGPIAGATSMSYAATTSDTYSVVVTDAGGCSVSTAGTPVSIYVNPTPVSYIYAPPTFCSGGTYTISAPGIPGNPTYTWSVNNGTLQSTDRYTAIIVAGTSGSVTIQLTVTDTFGCSWSGSRNVPVTANPPVPVITADGPTTFCYGNQVTLTAPAGYSYAWRVGTYDYGTAPSIILGESGSAVVTITDANGCSATSSPTVVTVNPNPTATITASGPTTLCAGGSVTLTASSGASYLWSTGATTQSITVNSSGSYSVTVTNANGCSAASSPTVVTVNANPTATITAGGPTTFCAGGSVTLTASSGASYLWSTGATTQSIIVSASGNYNVTVTNASGCSAASSPTAVTVNANPSATITAGGPTTFCAGGNVTLTASSGASYLWSTGATTQSIVVSANGNYGVTITSASGCSASATPVAVTVRAKPTASVSGNSSICPGGSATITAALTGTAPWSVTWSDNVTQTINTGTTATRSVSPSSTTSYTVTAVSDTNCSGTVSGNAVVTIKTLPTATVSGGGAICPGGSATITATLTGTAPWSVTWSDNVTQTINSGTVVTRSVSPTATTMYTVTSVSDAASCPRAGSGSATVTRNVGASITTQPTNVTTTRNTDVTLTVVALGTSPISYQWFNGNGTSITGATSASYTTSFTKKGTNTFYVEVWNACNTTHVKSNTVTVTVN